MYRHVPPQHPRRPNKKNFQFILDQFTHSDIKRWGDIKDLYLLTSTILANFQKNLVEYQWVMESTGL